MDRYLMMIYVSLDQERAMKKLFLDNGWKYQKPDLLKLTDQLGPLIKDKVMEDSGTAQHVQTEGTCVTSPGKRMVSPERVLTRSQKLPVSSESEKKSKRKQTMSEKADNSQSTEYDITVNDVEGVDEDDLTEYMDYGDEDDDFVDNQGSTSSKPRKRKNRASGDKSTHTGEEILEKLDGTEETEMSGSNQGNRTDDESNESSTDGAKNKFHSARKSLITGTRKKSLTSKPLFYQCGNCLIKFSEKEPLNKHLREVCNNHIQGGRKETGIDEVVGTKMAAADQRSVSVKSSTVPQDIDEENFNVKLELLGPEDSKDIEAFSGDGKKFFCDQPECESAFSTIYNLETHQKLKHGITFDNPVECNFCNKSFNSEHILSLHKQDQHALLLESVECDDCSEVCPNFSAYSTHKQTVHNTMVCLKPNKGYVCDTCGNCFVRLDSLKEHCDIVHLQIKKRKQVKSSGRKNVCDICGKAFLRRNNLTEHKKVVHDKTAKRYVCEECGASFLRPYSLERHTNKEHLKQKPYECDKCHKAFLSGVNLRQHKMACYKKEEDKLECTECGRRFHDMHNLKMHQEALHSENPFTCACGTVVKWRSSFAKHRRKCVLGQVKHVTRKIYCQRPRGQVPSEISEGSTETTTGAVNVESNSGVTGFTTISTDAGDQVVSEEIAQALRDQGLLVDGTVDGTLRLEDQKTSGDQDSAVQSVYYVILKE